jgi:hypothetical protein
MAQSDVGNVPAYRGEQWTKSEEDVADYHGQLLEQLRHVEDNVSKFAIQNYAASGAVVLAYLAGNASLGRYHHRSIAQHKLCHSDHRPV